MTHTKRWALGVLIAAAGVLAAGLARSAEPAPAGKAAEAKKIRVAVVTGGHPFEEAAFLKFFSGIDGIEFTHVPTKDGEIFQDISNWPYDVILLYSFNQKISDERRANFLKLLDKGVGLFVLHHAIAGFPAWPAYNDLFGGTYLLKPTEVNGKKVQSGYKHGVEVKVHIEDPNCPIAAGMKDYTIHDETYCRYLVDPNVHVFLTTDEPTSDKAIGWVKSHPKARICYIEHGHDHLAWDSPNFKQLITQAISWCACRTPLGDVSPNGATAASRPVEK